MGEYPRENKTEGEKNNCGVKRKAEGKRKNGGGGERGGENQNGQKQMQKIYFTKSNIGLCKLLFTKWQALNQNTYQCGAPGILFRCFELAQLTGE
jgi:hypothetical protein